MASLVPLATVNNEQRGPMSNNLCVRSVLHTVLVSLCVQFQIIYGLHVRPVLSKNFNVLLLLLSVMVKGFAGECLKFVLWLIDLREKINKYLKKMKFYEYFTINPN